MALDTLTLEGVDTFYGTSQILFGMGFSIPKGESVALLGRNGAGKSTTMKSIMGLAPLARGKVLLDGRNMARLRPDQIARAGIGYVPEDRQVFQNQSIEANLLLGAKAGVDGRRDWTLERIYEVFPMLGEMRHRLAGTLSGGQQQMLTMGRSLAGNPSILLLDEPSEGLAPVIMDQIQALIQQLRSMDMTLLIAEQNMRFCLDVASRVVVIDHGTVVFSGTVAEFNADSGVRERYLVL